MIVLLVMIQELYCTNTRECTNIPSCSGKLIFYSPCLQEGIFVYTLVKLYNKANILCYLFRWKNNIFLRLNTCVLLRVTLLKALKSTGHFQCFFFSSHPSPPPPPPSPTLNLKKIPVRQSSNKKFWPYMYFRKSLGRVDKSSSTYFNTE